jgi:hypothetical protein
MRVALDLVGDNYDQILIRRPAQAHNGPRVCPPQFHWSYSGIEGEHPAPLKKLLSIEKGESAVAVLVARQMVNVRGLVLKHSHMRRGLPIQKKIHCFSICWKQAIP